MADDLHRAFAQLRDAVLDDEHLVRALASGRRRGQPQPRWRRVELRYVDLKAGRHLQVTAYDDTQAHVTNRQDAAAAVDELLAEPFANWHVETTTHTHQLRVTKKGEPLLHTSERAEPVTPQRSHDHTKQRLLPEDHPRAPSARHLRRAGPGEAVPPGEVPPGRGVPARPGVAIDDATRTGKLREPTPQDPLRVVDLGCGNAYLTFAAHAWLSEQMPVRLVGVDVKEQSRRHNTEVAEELESRRASCRSSPPASGTPRSRNGRTSCSRCTPATPPPTTPSSGQSTGVQTWSSRRPAATTTSLLSCARPPPRPGTPRMTRDGILRERLADTLTDALRASILRLVGYRVDVVEFVDSKHTPRNTLLRAVRTGAEPRERAREEYDTLTTTWSLRPALAELLDRDSGR